MRNQLVSLFLGLTAAITTQSALANSYLCIADASVGFQGSNNWESVDFKATEKYIVRPLDSTNDLAGRFVYELVNFGEEDEIVLCKKIMHEVGRRVYCENITDTWEFVLHLDSLKFVVTYFDGYLGGDGDDNNADAHLTIGKCSKI